MTWKTIPELVQAAADRFGDAEAVVDGPVRLSFTELAERARVAAGAFAAAGIGKGDRAAIWAPNSAEWIIAAFGLLTAGGVLIPINTRFKAEEASDIIGRGGAKMLLVQKGFLGLDFAAPPGVPVIDLKSDFLSTGSPLTREVGGDEVCDIIFTSGTLSRPGDSFEQIATTVGAACDGYQVRIADDGEILVHSQSVMKGYLDDPAATAEAIDAGGWLHTGDVGSLDEDGRLRILGRKKDMFIVGGFNAYPAEIENFLLEHPAVAQVAVIGVPDERLGEVGKVFVVPRGPVTADELIAWSKERMAGFKVPRHVEFLKELPLNATGKVMKDKLR